MKTVSLVVDGERITAKSGEKLLWAALANGVYVPNLCAIQDNVQSDPLTCPKCQGQMRILTFIEDEEVIEKILKHLGLWDLKVRLRPR